MRQEDGSILIMEVLEVTPYLLMPCGVWDQAGSDYRSDRTSTPLLSLSFLNSLSIVLFSRLAFSRYPFSRPFPFPLFSRVALYLSLDPCR